MYKKQMKFQRIICLLAIVSSALVFVYALGIMTDIYEMMNTLVPDQNDPSSELVPGARLYVDMQPFVHFLTIAGIGLILLALLLLLTNTHTRRKYYISNLFAVLLFTAGAFFVAIYSHGQIEGFKTVFLTFHAAVATGKYDSLDALNRVREYKYLNDSTFWFDVNNVVFGILILVALLLVGNYIAKRILMKKEAEMIGQTGTEADGADVALDRMRFAKNKASSRLAYLAIVADVLFFIALYRINDDFLYQNLIGISVVYNLLFMLAAFLSSEGVKNYKPAYSYVMIVLAVIQVVRIFIFPVQARARISATTGLPVMDIGKFIRCLLYLLVSAACLITGAVINLNKSKALQSVKA